MANKELIAQGRDLKTGLWQAQRYCQAQGAHVAIIVS